MIMCNILKKLSRFVSKKALFVPVALVFVISCQRLIADTSVVLEKRAPEEVTGEIDVWAWNIAAASLEDVVPLFNEKYPNVKVDVHMNMTDMQSRFLLSLSAGVGAPDITQLLMEEVQWYNETGRMLDLTAVAAQYKKDFIPSFWKSCVYDGKVYALPWGSGPCAVFYKRHIFKTYGIDPNAIETWDDFIEAGKIILKKSGGKTKMCHMPVVGKPNGLARMFDMLIQQNGGQLFDKQGRITINSSECLQAIKLIRKMFEAGITVNEEMYSHAHYASLKNDSTATYPTAVWWGGSIKDYAPETKGDWGVFRLPALEPGGLRVSNSGGSALVIPDQCKNKEAAWAFMEFVLCNPEIQNIQYKEYDLMPCLIPAFDDPFYDQPDPFFAGQKVRKFFVNDIEKIRPLNRNADWMEGLGWVSQVFSEWAANDLNLSDEQLLIEIEDLLQQRLDRAIAPSSLRYQRREAKAKKK